MTFKNLLLSVQRQMIGEFTHDHLRQQARTRRAFFDWLRRLSRRPHRTGASVLLAHILDHSQLRGNVFVALTRLFTDQAEILPADVAVLFLFGQVVENALPLQLTWQRLAAAALFVGTWFACTTRPAIIILVIGTGT